MTTSAGRAATDLGRRIAARRREAGLSREQAARRARMAATYLTYLETDPDASPEPGALIRLAAALGTSRSALAGAGLEQPPGRQPPQRPRQPEPLAEAECHAYLRAGGVGRFVFDDARGPVAIPVNYRMLGGDVVFRTSALTSLAGRAPGRLVSFEVDRIDEDLGEGWSVLVSGRAHLITDGEELREARALRVAPWAGGARETYVRVVPERVTGRRVRAG